MRKTGGRFLRAVLAASVLSGGPAWAISAGTSVHVAATPFARAGVLSAGVAGPLLQKALSPRTPGGPELLRQLPKTTRAALQAIERLDLNKEEDRAALERLTRRLPEGFEAKLHSYMESPTSLGAEIVAAQLALAHEPAAEEAGQEARATVKALLDSAAKGEQSPGKLEAAARELDRLDLYGSEVWGATNLVREAALRLRRRESDVSSREIASRLLGRLEGADGAVAAKPKAAASSEPALPDEATPDEIAAAIATAIEKASGYEMSISGSAKDNFKGYAFPGGRTPAFTMYGKMLEKGYTFTVESSYITGLVSALAAEGLVLVPGLTHEGSHTYGVEPRIYPPARAAALVAAALHPESAKPIRLAKDAEAIKAQIDQAMMPADVREEIAAEAERLAQMAPTSAEATVSRTYIERLLNLPWARSTEDRLDIPAARAMLDEDQHGLDEVKRRILEFLAVRKLKQDTKGAILLFVGPPGVGKTALAKSIARSMGRRYGRVPLGGVGEESVIRGHSRTYIGAKPGEIMRQIMLARSRNPVMLADEIDKLDTSKGGGPTAALLEAFDPSQHKEFLDHYVDVPFDLSEVLFVATANELSGIPVPLRDRMEIIEFRGYTPLEKRVIGRDYLLPRALKENGLAPEHLGVMDAVMDHVIDGYTFEAGVRGLNQVINRLARAVALRVAEHGEAGPGLLTRPSQVQELLGEAPNVPELKPAGVGVGIGLGVMGGQGSILRYTAKVNPGTGKLSLRNHMKEKMTDSAQNVLAVVKSVALAQGIEEKVFRENDIDIAISPAHDTDGPSAGVVGAVTLISALKKIPVRQGVAMTGELDMDSNVLPIGGVLEKAMAAHRAGMHVFGYPAANQSDVDALPDEVKRGMKLVPLETMDDAVALALAPAPAAAETAPATANER